MDRLRQYFDARTKSAFYKALSTLDTTLVIKLLKKQPQLALMVDSFGFTTLMLMVMSPGWLVINYPNTVMHFFDKHKGFFFSSRNTQKRLLLAKTMIDMGVSVDARTIDVWRDLPINSSTMRAIGPIAGFIKSTPTISLAQDVEFVRLLLDNGADASATDNDGKTVLMWGVTKDASSSFDIARELIHRGADVNAVDKDNYTALHHHLEASSVEPYEVDLNVARMLLDAGTDVNARTNDNETPLMFAMSRDLTVIKLLLDRGADVNVEDNIEGLTPLLTHLACCSDWKVFKTLLDAGADVLATTTGGETSLMYAASSPTTSTPRIIKELINRGVDVNAIDMEGTTALSQHLRFYGNGYPEVVKILVDAGAGLDPEKPAMHNSLNVGNAVVNDNTEFLNDNVMPIQNANNTTNRKYFYNTGNVGQNGRVRRVFNSEVLERMKQTNRTAQNPFTRQPWPIHNVRKMKTVLKAVPRREPVLQQDGGAKKHVTIDGKKYKVQVGARGGKFVVVDGKKKYV